MNKYKCPECGTNLVYDHETSCKIIFYCPTCNKKVMAWKG